MPDLADLNPDFASRLNQLEAALGQQGMGFNIVSGYRDNALQAKLYANYQARKAGQSIPYPEEGNGGLAAPPGQSYHNYGMAADFELSNPANYAKLRSMATQFGLTGIGPNDPGHIQMANWSIPAGGTAVAEAQHPGTTLNTSGGSFINALIQAESNNRNIPSTVDKDPPGFPGGKSQGYVQINTPTWQQFAPQAGVSLQQYPNAMSAPRDVQIQVGSLIPVSRFGQRTQNLLTKQFGQFDTSQTVGALNSQFGGTTLTTSNVPAATTPPGSGITTPNVQPSPASLFAQGNIMGGLGAMNNEGMFKQAGNLYQAARQPQPVQPMQAPNLQPNRPNPQMAEQMLASLGMPKPPQGALAGQMGSMTGMDPRMMMYAGMNPYTMMPMGQ